MTKPTTQINKVVSTRVQTPHKMNIHIQGGKGMTTIKVGKAINDEGELVRPTEFVLHTSEMECFAHALLDYIQAIEENV